MQVYLTLYAGNSTRIEVRGLSAYVGVDNTVYDNAAAVTARLLDDIGAELPGQVWPLPLLYEGASDGNYSGVISAALAVSPGDQVTAEVTATSGADQALWSIPCEVELRTHRSGYG